MGDLIGPNPTEVGGPKSEKSNGRKYENFFYRRTDKADYIGPGAGPKRERGWGNEAGHFEKKKKVNLNQLQVN